MLRAVGVSSRAGSYYQNWEEVEMILTHLAKVQSAFVYVPWLVATLSTAGRYCRSQLKHGSHHTDASVDGSSLSSDSSSDDSD